jgi:hypothetical protein
MNVGSLKAISGLIAVVVAVLAVAGLTAFTLTQLGSGNKDSIVAVTTSAFGIISAVVGAYLGIKITADTSDKANTEAKHAAVAQHEASVLSETLSAVTSKVEEVAPGQAAEIKDAAKEAEETARTSSVRRWKL